MKKVTLLILAFLFSFLMFGQSNDMENIKTEIENEITIAKSEIKNCNVKLKINKNDASAIYTLSQNKAKLKELENDLKIVKETIKAESKYLDLEKKYNKQKEIYDNQIDLYYIIKEKYER